MTGLFAVRQCGIPGDGVIAADWVGEMGILGISCGHGDGGLSGQGVSGEWEVQLRRDVVESCGSRGR